MFKSDKPNLSHRPTTTDPSGQMVITASLKKLIIYSKHHIWEMIRLGSPIFLYLKVLIYLYGVPFVPKWCCCILFWYFIAYRYSIVLLFYALPCMQ